MNKKYTNGT